MYGHAAPNNMVHLSVSLSLFFSFFLCEDDSSKIKTNANKSNDNRAVLDMNGGAPFIDIAKENVWMGTL